MMGPHFKRSYLGLEQTHLIEDTIQGLNITFLKMVTTLKRTLFGSVYYLRYKTPLSQHCYELHLGYVLHTFYIKRVCSSPR